MIAPTTAEAIQTHQSRLTFICGSAMFELMTRFPSWIAMRMLPPTVALAFQPVSEAATLVLTAIAPSARVRSSPVS